MESVSTWELILDFISLSNSERNPDYYLISVGTRVRQPKGLLLFNISRYKGKTTQRSSISHEPVRTN